MTNKFIQIDEGGNWSMFKNCRPVRRDEVNFYTTEKGEKEND